VLVRDGEIGIGQKKIVQGPCPPLIAEVRAGLGREFMSQASSRGTNTFSLERLAKARSEAD